MDQTGTKPGPSKAAADSFSMRGAAALMALGQILHIAVTQLHAGGDANNHPAIFAAYAASDIWKAVHLGQFASMAILLAGLLLLFRAAAVAGSSPICALGAACAIAAFALYAVLQAVDGVALKEAVDAWAAAPGSDKAVRFANAESLRWLEWGMRSYQAFAMGLALILAAAAVGKAHRGARAIPVLIVLSGLAYLAQGWIAGREGFTGSMSVLIVAAWGFGLSWSIWLAAARRPRAPETALTST